jgi:hypothetical protein
MTITLNRDLLRSAEERLHCLEAGTCCPTDMDRQVALSRDYERAIDAEKYLIANLRRVLP